MSAFVAREGENSGAAEPTAVLDPYILEKVTVGCSFRHM